VAPGVVRVDRSGQLGEEPDQPLAVGAIGVAHPRHVVAAPRTVNEVVGDLARVGHVARA